MRQMIFIVGQVVVLLIALGFDVIGGSALPSAARDLHSERAGAPAISWFMTAAVGCLYWSSAVWRSDRERWIHLVALLSVWVTVVSQIEFLLWPTISFGPVGIAVGVAASFAPLVLLVTRLLSLRRGAPSGQQDQT